MAARLVSTARVRSAVSTCTPCTALESFHGSMVRHGAREPLVISSLDIVTVHPQHKEDTLLCYCSNHDADEAACLTAKNSTIHSTLQYAGKRLRFHEQISS